MGRTFHENPPAKIKMIVVGDGDMVLNDVSSERWTHCQWDGLNLFEYSDQTQYEYQFANREFLLNCVEYLVSNPAISETRNKDIVLRLLDSNESKRTKNHLAIHQYRIARFIGCPVWIYLPANPQKKICSVSLSTL